MATYLELLQAQANDTLRQKVRVACVVAADAVRVESYGTANHANRLAWAKGVMQNPELAGDAMVWAVLAQNAAVPLANILGASDAAVQTAVAAAIDLMAG